MSTSINVVVSCTEKKTRCPSPELVARHLPNWSAERRAEAWIQRLESSAVDQLPASDLYTGNHWHIVRQLRDHGQDLDVRVWIASAGYGLVPIDCPLKPYSITFAQGLDSVGSADEARRWWRTLSSWSGPVVGAPRSILELAQRDPDTPILVAISASYSGALACDLKATAQRDGSRHRLALISAGLRSSHELGGMLVPSDARYRPSLGGQMHSLNVRLAQHALNQSRQWMPDTSLLRELFQAELKDLPDTPMIARSHHSDDVIADYIREQLMINPRVGHTTLLRRWRAANNACEQSRFKRLFEHEQSRLER